jgi:hemoglobin-like flavoprotein
VSAVPGLTRHQILLVQHTFRQLRPVSDQVADLFYTRVFELNPELRPMFPSDLRAQGKKLMVALGTTVNGLSDPDRLLPAMDGLARRHVGYGVKPEHFDTVGHALLWALEKGLGPVFTADVKQAWTDAYRFLSSYMLRAWQVPAPPPQPSSQPAPAVRPRAAPSGGSRLRRWLGLR